jgi:hypothetical protein
MKPGAFDLPVIWRGCDWPAIIFKWKKVDGTPFDLNGWLPYAKSQRIDFNPQIADSPGGVTTISLTKAQTKLLRLGVESWDWIWVYTPDGKEYPPILAGRVEIKDPTTEV